MTSSSVKTSIPETKTFLCSFSFLLFFLTVIQLLCFYSCYSLSPTPIINFYGSRLKDTKEFIIFLHSHTLLSRFLFTRDQDRISPQQYQYNITGSARGGSGIPIYPKKNRQNTPKYPKFLQIYPKIIKIFPIR